MFRSHKISDFCKIKALSCDNICNNSTSFELPRIWNDVQREYICNGPNFFELPRIWNDAQWEYMQWFSLHWITLNLERCAAEIYAMIQPRLSYLEFLTMRSGNVCNDSASIELPWIWNDAQWDYMKWFSLHWVT